MVRIIDMECNMPRRGSYSIDFHLLVGQEVSLCVPCA